MMNFKRLISLKIERFSLSEPRRRVERARDGGRRVNTAIGGRGAAIGVSIVATAAVGFCL